MAVLPVVVVADNNPVLTTKASHVPKVDGQIRRLMEDMIETMRANHGVGLAAPQIGISLRVIVLEVDGRVHQLANPELVRCQGEQIGYEGCLSVPGLVGEVARCERVVAKGLNRNGKEIRVKGDDLLARAIQHEIDHLDGVLFTTKVTPGTLREASLDEVADDVAGEVTI